MRILVTRPLPDAETTAADLSRLGHDPILAPMLETHFINWPVADPSSPLPDALVATSPNGVRAIARHPQVTELQALPLFVAGDASSRLAGSLGFLDVRSAQGDAADVTRRIAADLAAQTTLLYAAGHDRTGDLAESLTAKGYRVELREVYRAVAVHHFQPEIAAHIRRGEIDRILVFSARTSEAILAALVHSDLLPVSRSIPIHAISHQAAEPFRLADFRSIVIASRPDAAELLDTLESMP